MELLNASELRRLIFVIQNIAKELPFFEDIVIQFSCPNKSHLAKEILVYAENLTILEPDCFIKDYELWKLLADTRRPDGSKYGIILLSSNSRCKVCDRKLVIRSDRPSSLAVYTEHLGTLAGSHYRKYCQHWRHGCSFTQHYGCHKIGDDASAGRIFFDDNWDTLPFVLSTHETAFQTSLLEAFNSELLLGQLSYKQKSEIYNDVNGYSSTLTKKVVKSNLQDPHAVTQIEKEKDTE